jgi:hypothetical protein
MNIKISKWLRQYLILLHSLVVIVAWFEAGVRLE